MIRSSLLLRRRRWAGALVATALLVGAGCRAPGANDVQTTQAILEIGDAVNDIRHENAMLQQQIDSLRTVLARQDTLLRQLSNLAGVARE